MLLSRSLIIFIVSLFLYSQQAFAMGSIMNNSSTKETQKTFSFEDYEVDNKNIEPMKQDLLKRFPIGSDYAPFREELLKAGAITRKVHPDLIKQFGYHPNSRIFDKEYYKLLWHNLHWVVLIDTDEKIIKKVEISTFGLSFK